MCARSLMPVCTSHGGFLLPHSENTIQHRQSDQTAPDSKEKQSSRPLHLCQVPSLACYCPEQVSLQWQAEGGSAFGQPTGSALDHEPPVSFFRLSHLPQVQGRSGELDDAMQKCELSPRACTSQMNLHSRTGCICLLPPSPGKMWPVQAPF